MEEYEKQENFFIVLEDPKWLKRGLSGKGFRVCVWERENINVQVICVIIVAKAWVKYEMSRKAWLHRLEWGD